MKNDTKFDEEVNLQVTEKDLEEDLRTFARLVDEARSYLGSYRKVAEEVGLSPARLYQLRRGMKVKEVPRVYFLAINELLEELRLCEITGQEFKGWAQEYDLPTIMEEARARVFRTYHEMGLWLGLRSRQIYNLRNSKKPLSARKHRLYGRLLAKAIGRGLPPLI